MKAWTRLRDALGGVAGPARAALALALVFALAIGGLAGGLTQRADAAPSGIVGPDETFTATVVPDTIVPVAGGVRFNAERPAKLNPAELEQLVVETVLAPLVKPREILSITGNYDTESKIFKATNMTSLGNAGGTRAASSTAGAPPRVNDNDSDDNGNRSNSHPNDNR